MPEKQKPSSNDLNTRKKNTNTRKPTTPRKNSGKNPPPDDNFQWLKVTRTLAFWIILVFLGLYFFNYFGNQQPSEDEISYSEFQTLLNADVIKSAIVESKELRGKIIAEDISQGVSDRIYKIKNQIAEIDEKLAAGVQQDYSVSEIYKAKATLAQQLVDNEELLKGLKEFRKTHQTLTQFKVFLGEEPSALVAEKWQASIKDFRFKPGSAQWTQMLYYFSPWILAIAFWIFIMRRMQAGGTKGIFSFGKSRAKLSSENRPKVTFEDVAGADEAKQELQEIIEFLKEPEKFQRLGGKIPKGALLLGPPGTGKTLLAKAVSGEAGVPFFSMSGADFVEMFVGVGASRVRDLFEQGKKNAPCIIFIDEVDAVGRHRGAGLGGGHDEREQTLNQLLVEMDGFDSNEGVILIAATNRPDVLDHALLRPGRFDRQIVVDIPDVRGREGILKVHIKNIPLASGVNLSILAKGTPGFSGADLANMVNEAALLAARYNKNQVDMKDLEAAKEKVMMGAERKSMILNDDEKRSTAYHEAGHALVGTLIPGTDPVHKVTIIPRGRALGATMQLPIDERHTYNREYLEGVVCVLLGGRVAEKLVFNTYTSGASSDIERGTEIARKMVCEYGMSEKLGPLSFGKKQEEIFLGREITQHRDYSEKTAQMIDEEVKNLIIQAEKKVEKLLIENLDKLHLLVKILMEKEFIDHDEIMAIVDKDKKVEPSPEEVKADIQK